MVTDRAKIASALVAATPTYRGTIVAAVMPNPDALISVLKSLRSAGATEDVVGFAIPLTGDPTDPTTEVDAVRPEVLKRRFDPATFLLDLLDPHRPVGQTDEWSRGKNGVLARRVLGDLTHWLVGVLTWRVPGPDGGPGVWVLGRPNHAAALRRSHVPGPSSEGPGGAVSSLGLPVDVSRRYAERLLEGQSVLTTCETDQGRAKRDARVIQKHGGRDLFELDLAVDYGVRKT